MNPTSEKTIEEANDEQLGALRAAALQTSASILALQRRTEEELLQSKEELERRATELDASLALLNATLESTADGIVAIDLAGRVISYNTKFVAIWQMPEVLLATRDSAVLMAYSAQQTKDPQQFWQRLEEVQSKPEIEACDVIELKDGRTFERYRFPQWLNGQCVGIVVNFREVTEHKRAEAALRRSEEKYRLLWATAGDAFVLFDSNNKILEANAAVTAIFGYQPEELIGQEIALLQPERLREGHRQGIRRYLATGKRKLDWRSTETIGLHRDGHEVPIEIAFNHVPVDGEELFAGFVRDITERKRAEDVHARLAAIVDSSEDAIISKTLQGIITSWNKGATRLFGYNAEEVIGKSILILIPPHLRDEETMILSRLQKGERIEHFETVRMRKDGEFVHISLTISPVRAADGTVIGVSKIARNITDRKKTEAERELLLQREQLARTEAEAANRARDEFLAIVSHELRTPLNSMLGWAELLMIGDVDEQAMKQGLEIILRNVQVQTRLVNDLLDVSRIITNKMNIEMHLVEPDRIVLDAINVVRPEAESKGIELKVKIASGIAPLLGDGQRLQQCVWNLLSNAVKFTPPGGEVEVCLTPTASDVLVQVRDTGAGITPSFLPYVFERLRQADSSATRGGGGLGLGLSIVRHIVDLHGGTVTAESAGEGQGATFTIALPLNGKCPDGSGKTPPCDSEL